MRRDGLTIKGMSDADRFKVPVRALDICDVPQLVYETPIDVAFISVKSYDTKWATALILPYLASDGVIVSLQNSINEEQIASIAGWGRTMGCSISSLSGELERPGLISRHSPPGNRQKPGLRVGEVHASRPSVPSRLRIC